MQRLLVRCSAALPGQCHDAPNKKMPVLGFRQAALTGVQAYHHHLDCHRTGAAYDLSASRLGG